MRKKRRFVRKQQTGRLTSGGEFQSTQLGSPPLSHTRIARFQDLVRHTTSRLQGWQRVQNLHAQTSGTLHLLIADPLAGSSRHGCATNLAAVLPGCGSPPYMGNDHTWDTSTSTSSTANTDIRHLACRYPQRFDTTPVFTTRESPVRCPD